MSAKNNFATGCSPPPTNSRPARCKAQVEVWEAAAARDRGSSVEERRPEALRRIAEAHARLARVHVLFGRQSVGGDAATQTINALWDGRSALEADPPDVNRALNASSRALELLNEFTTAARAALQEPWNLSA